MMDHLNTDTNSKKVALFLIATKGRQIAFRVIENLTKLSGLDLFVISHNAIDIKDLINDINDRAGKKICYFEASSNSVCQKRNMALLISIANKYDYCILSDDDIMIENASDIGKLVNLFKSLPEECAVLSPALKLAGRPIYGGLLYCNGTFMSLETQPASSVWYSLCPSAAFIAVRVKSIARMFEVGLRPFEELFVIQSEDVDFAMKFWSLGYKIACTKLVKVRHQGDRERIPPQRLFFMYRNRVLLVLLNFSVAGVLCALPFRILNDVFHNIVLLRTCHFSSLAKAYLWILRHARTILTLRNHRQRCFKYDERRLLAQLPLPLLWRSKY
ncbi:hypothetical protein MUO83_08800 [Candidatus Bathyarchaeota archaeon]|nr:hypothetical protein [Candidatus Bathyarchaeota archaeon]